MGSGCWSGWRRRVRCCRRRQHGARQRPAGSPRSRRAGGTRPGARGSWWICLVFAGRHQAVAVEHRSEGRRLTDSHLTRPGTTQRWTTSFPCTPHGMPYGDGGHRDCRSRRAPRVSAARPTGRTGEDGGRPLLPHLDRHTELAEDVRDVDARRLAGDEELLGDLVVACAVRDQAEHLDLARCSPSRSSSPTADTSWRLAGRLLEQCDAGPAGQEFDLPPQRARTEPVADLGGSAQGMRRRRTVPRRCARFRGSKQRICQRIGASSSSQACAARVQAGHPSVSSSGSSRQETGPAGSGDRSGYRKPGRDGRPVPPMCRAAATAASS